MSIVLVTFPGAPKPSPEAQQAEKELDETLRQRLTGCYTSLLHACSHTHRVRSRNIAQLRRCSRQNAAPSSDSDSSANNDARG